MGAKTLAVTMGLGVMVGAVAVLMLPHTSTVRKMANKAASTVEEAAGKMSMKLTDAMDM